MFSARAGQSAADLAVGTRRATGPRRPWRATVVRRLAVRWPPMRRTLVRRPLPVRWTMRRGPVPVRRPHDDRRRHDHHRRPIGWAVGRVGKEVGRDPTVEAAATDVAPVCFATAHADGRAGRQRAGAGVVGSRASADVDIAGCEGVSGHGNRRQYHCAGQHQGSRGKSSKGHRQFSRPNFIPNLYTKDPLWPSSGR